MPDEDATASVLGRWATAINDVMAEIHWLRAKRLMFKRWQSIVIDHLVLREYPQDFLWFIDKSHAADAAAAGRRQWGSDSDELSMHRLLKDVRHVADELTVEWWMDIGAAEAPRSPHQEQDLREDFLRHFGSGESPGVLDVRRVQADITALVGTCEPVARFATSVVAHALDSPVTAPTWTQIDDAVQLLDDLSRRYFLLLKCGSFAPQNWFHEPDPNWPTIFEVPWARSATGGGALRAGRGTG